MQLFKDLFFQSKIKDWTDGLEWLGWHLICGLMPIWITLLLLRIFNQNIDVQVFTNNGEFALYSASFLGTCFYIVIRDFRKSQFPNRAFFALLIVPILLFSGLMYSIVALLNILADANIISPLNQFDRDFVRNASLIILPFVFILSFIIMVADNVKGSMDIKEIAKESYNKLDRQFDKTGVN